MIARDMVIVVTEHVIVLQDGKAMIVINAHVLLTVPATVSVTTERVTV
jgi:hypothetical protein